MTTSRRHSAGFTLLEILVAVAIFAVIGAAAMGSLDSLTRQRQDTRESLDRLKVVQQALTLLGRDLTQMRPVAARGAIHGNLQPALRGAEGDEYPLEFTRGGQTNPLGIRRSSLMRVAWRLEDDGLIRYHWGLVDLAPDSTPVRAIVLKDVTDFSVRFMSAAGNPTLQWPPLTTEGMPALQQLPRAVEVTLELRDLGEIRRLVELPDFAAASASATQGASGNGDGNNHGNGGTTGQGAGHGR
ncbi:MAG: type II secretion system minor pseudopilin GspJ [Gammaproteobacteria bacterium]|jgi:general secretion pathway protein J